MLFEIESRAVWNSTLDASASDQRTTVTGSVELGERLSGRNKPVRSGVSELMDTGSSSRSTISTTTWMFLLFEPTDTATVRVAVNADAPADSAPSCS